AQLAGGSGRNSSPSLPVPTLRLAHREGGLCRDREQMLPSVKSGLDMGRTPRVLVIDDDRPLCELIRTTFELEGFDVETAYDVIEAERVLVESRPDAILLDIGLPGIDGIFYLERLRETPQTSKIPIVAISG